MEKNLLNKDTWRVNLFLYFIAIKIILLFMLFSNHKECINKLEKNLLITSQFFLKIFLYDNCAIKKPHQEALPM